MTETRLETRRLTVVETQSLVLCSDFRNFVYGELLNLLMSLNEYLVVYADDLVIVVTARDT